MILIVFYIFLNIKVVKSVLKWYKMFFIDLRS